MNLLFPLADNRNPHSLAAYLRRRRGRLVRALLATLPRPLRMLDVGGTQRFWDVVEPDGLAGVTTVLLNREATPVTRSGFESIAGDARSLAFPDRSFDVVFSNSVIEHVGTGEDQRRMADEIRRVSLRYYVQTPNKWFPIEPHFLVPGFQFLPVSVRTELLMRFRLGWYPRQHDRARAEELVSSIRLLDERELRSLFPGAAIRHERFLTLTKSLIAIGGFEEPR